MITETLNEEDLLTYLGRNPEPYLVVFEKLKRTNKLPSFSLSLRVFFVAWAWLAYRKLWVELIVFLGTFALMTVVCSVLDITRYIFALFVAFSGCIAMSSKAMVLSKATKSIRKINVMNVIGRERQKALSDIGGVSLVGFWVTFTLLYGLPLIALGTFASIVIAAL